VFAVDVRVRPVQVTQCSLQSVAPFFEKEDTMLASPPSHRASQARLEWHVFTKTFRARAEFATRRVLRVRRELYFFRDAALVRETLPDRDVL
jgi:hypothetical protein